MKKILLPLVLLLLGLGGGVGAAMFLPAAAPETTDADPPAEDATEAAEAADDDQPAEDPTPEPDPDKGPVEFLNMSNQFVIPLVDDGEVNGIVVLTLSLEVVEGTIASVNLLEPKIRDKFLQVLFNHANNGGFDGNFTDFRYLQSLKDELLRNAQVVAGKNVTDVLILDLVRQNP